MEPAYKVTVNGSDISALIEGRLLSLSVTDEAGVNSDRMEIVLDDRDARLSIPPTRATAKIEIGYKGTQLVDKGTFVIEDIEIAGPGRTMTFRGTSIGASRGSGASREVSWHDTTFGKIAESIAQRHKWKLAISQELAVVEIEHIDQRENDMQFLSRIAAQNDAVAKVSSGRLIINSHGTGKRVSGGEIPGVVIEADETTDWSMTMAERGDYDGVKAAYHDLRKGERGEVVDGEDTVNTSTMQHTYASKAQATKAAKARRRALKRAKATFSVYNMPGRPSLRAEVAVEAKNFRPGVDGEWLATRVVHRITNSGYTSSIDCETPESKAEGSKK